MLVHWLMDEGLMAKERSSPMCAGEMSLTRYEDRSDGLKWECRKQVNWLMHKRTKVYSCVVRANERARYTV